jgi:hypothetical protein
MLYAAAHNQRIYIYTKYIHGVPWIQLEQLEQSTELPYGVKIYLTIYFEGSTWSIDAGSRTAVRARLIFEKVIMYS